MDRSCVDTASTIDGMQERRGCCASNGYTYLDSRAHMTMAERIMVRVEAKMPQRERPPMKKNAQNSTVRVAGNVQSLSPGLDLALESFSARRPHRHQRHQRSRLHQRLSYMSMEVARS